MATGKVQGTKRQREQAKREKKKRKEERRANRANKTPEDGSEQLPSTNVIANVEGGNLVE